MHGKCFVEIGKWQETQVADIITENGYEIINIQNDLAGVPRVISFARPYLKIVN